MIRHLSGHRPTATAITAAALLLLSACGGDGGTGGGSPTAPGPSIIFTPDRAATGNSISLRAGAPG